MHEEIKQVAMSPEMAKIFVERIGLASLKICKDAVDEVSQPSGTHRDPRQERVMKWLNELDNDGKANVESIATYAGMLAVVTVLDILDKSSWRLSEDNSFLLAAIREKVVYLSDERTELSSEFQSYLGGYIRIESFVSNSGVSDHRD